MNLNQFDIEMQRLRGVFGDRLYPEERIRILWNLLKDAEPWWLSKLITHFISSCRQAPLVPEFQEAIALEKDRILQKARAEKLKDDDLPPNPDACIYCGDSGVLMCLHKKKGGFWAFKCICPLGRLDKRSLPVLKTGHLEEGFEYLTLNQFMALKQQRIQSES